MTVAASLTASLHTQGGEGGSILLCKVTNLVFVCQTAENKGEVIDSMSATDGAVYHMFRLEHLLKSCFNCMANKAPRDMFVRFRWYF